MKRTLSFATVALLILGTVLSVYAIYDQIATGSWGPAGDMAQARSGAAAVRLEDGRVLFTGGTGANGVLNSAEALTAGGGFAAVAPMAEARSNHTATMLLDGRVLVAGGDNGAGATLTAEVYDPSANAWWNVGNLLTARAGHTASLLQDGRVLIAGGENSGGPVTSLEIFDPNGNSFSNAGTLNTARSGHAAAVMADGRVLIVGGKSIGQDGNPVTLSSVEIYNPADGSVTGGASLSSARSGHSATTLLDGPVFVMGGSDGSQDLASAEIYDPSADTWTSTSSSAATPRSGHAAFLLPDNANVLIVGGSSAGAELASAELFEPWSGQFKSTGSLAAAHPGVAGAAIGAEGFLAVAGGSSQATGEVYHFATVKTDEGDYSPGEYANISGSGWQPGETVTFTFHEDLATPFHPDEVETAVADASGNVSGVQYLLEDHDAGLRYYLTAVGVNSQARTTFTDASLTGAIVTVKNAACSANQTTFTVGDTVCASVAVTTSGGGGNPDLFIEWFNPSNALVLTTTKSGVGNGSTQTDSLSLTTTNAVAGTWTIQSCKTIGCSGGNLADTKTFMVNPGPATKYVVTSSDSNPVAGTVVTITAQLADTNGNPVSTAGKVVTWSKTGSGGSFGSPTSITNASGIATVSFTTSTVAGTIYAVTATDNTGLTGTSGNITTVEGTLHHFAFATISTPQTAGMAFNITITALDINGNTVTSFSGNGNKVNLTSTGTLVFTNPSVAFTGGVLTTSVSISNAGTFTITATGTGGNSGVSGTSNSFNVVSPDSKAPIVTISFAAPDGLNSWYVHSPVAGTVDANDSTTGNSNVTAISCTDGVSPLAVGSLSGIGTNHATGSISVSGEGTHNISCTAADSAGNTGAFTGSTAMPVVVKIDTVKPSLSASRLTAANGNGWNNTNVGVEFTCTDATSGLASINATGAASGSSITSPLDVTVTTEGAGQSVNGSCTDAAGNSADPASVTNIDIDKTKPAISGSQSPAANVNGWNNTDVAVSFSCADNAGGSGVDIDTVAGATLTTEGSGQSVTNSGSCVDKAGNTADPATVNNINIDKTAPTAVVTPDRVADHNTWYNHALTFSTSGSSDALSGIDSCTAVGTYSGPDNASANVSTTCTDKAGNSANGSFSFKYDATAPVLVLAFTPDSPDGNNGWWKTPGGVPFAWTCNDATSGIDAGYNGGCPSPLSGTVTAQGTTNFTGQVKDQAGNLSIMVNRDLKLDNVAPAIALFSRLPGPNVNGWNNADVTVVWTCSDATSGPTAASDTKTVTTEGDNQSATGNCTDFAGNGSSNTQSGISIDKTKPTVTLVTPPTGSPYTLNQVVTASFTCGDSLSGFASSNASTASGPNGSDCVGPATANTSTVGAHSYGAGVVATDKAGNTSDAVNTTYNVNYIFVGFLQPIDNLPVVNTANAGRVIPIKWQLKDANGNLVSDLGSLTSLLAQQTACTAAPNDILTDTMSSPGATVFRFDGTQFIYNWQTAKNWNGCWLLQATFNDGTKQYAKFSFK